VMTVEAIRCEQVSGAVNVVDAYTTHFRRTPLVTIAQVQLDCEGVENLFPHKKSVLRVRRRDSKVVATSMISSTC